MVKVLLLINFVISLTLNAQFKIQGVIKSKTGESIPFAVVSIGNNQYNEISEIDGFFEFKNLKAGHTIFKIKSLGFADLVDTFLVTTDAIINFVMEESNKQLDEVVVNATRVDKNSGMAFNNLESETLNKLNLGQDAPFVLNQLPNVVINSDAGNGIGYTGIRIRGSDGARINVTINGVPVNDAESQLTYFVNMPDIVSSSNNIQVQRGVGASSNGAGAFGASINFQTNQLKDKPFASVISTAGSFNTIRNTLSAGTGLMNNKFTLDARASKITSNGYIDRSTSNLQSYYIAAGYYGKKSVLKFINFSGHEKTYQAWNYVLEDSIANGNRTYNSCGEYKDENGKVKYYENEVDNYTQSNFQLHFIHQINSKFNFNVVAHYTKGNGYYEQYKQNQSFKNYFLNNIITPRGDTISNTNLIRRLWLDNDFAGGIFNFNYIANSKLNFILGGGYNTYFGLHYDRLIWSQYSSNSEINYQYNSNSANKNDANLYLKTNYKPVSNLNIFVDLQLRNIDYRFLGFDDSLNSKMQNQTYLFLNPKIGLSFDFNSQLNLYLSTSVASKEPNRNDFVQSSIKSRPKPEQLIDLEAGIKYASKIILINANFYNMVYINQLVLNGQINNVGAYNRVNVASSYRRGIELELNGIVNKYMSIGGNISLSENKICSYIEYTDSNDVNYTIYTQYKKDYKNTDISFSPKIVSSSILSIKPTKNFEITFLNKFVGKQFLDNTSNLKQSINAYNVLDVRVNFLIKTIVIPEVSLMLSVSNVLSNKYETNGYTYSYYEGKEMKTANYLAPSAPINFLAGLSLKF